MRSQRQLNAVTILVTKVQLIDKTNNIPWMLDPHYCSHKSQQQIYHNTSSISAPLYRCAYICVSVDLQVLVCCIMFCSLVLSFCRLDLFFSSGRNRVINSRNVIVCKNDLYNNHVRQHNINNSNNNKNNINYNFTMGSQKVTYWNCLSTYVKYTTSEMK